MTDSQLPGRQSHAAMVFLSSKFLRDEKAMAHQAWEPMENEILEKSLGPSDMFRRRTRLSVAFLYASFNH